MQATNLVLKVVEVPAKGRSIAHADGTRGKGLARFGEAAFYNAVANKHGVDLSRSTEPGSVISSTLPNGEKLEPRADFIAFVRSREQATDPWDEQMYKKDLVAAIAEVQPAKVILGVPGLYEAPSQDVVTKRKALVEELLEGRTIQWFNPPSELPRDLPEEQRAQYGVRRDLGTEITASDLVFHGSRDFTTQNVSNAIKQIALAVLGPAKASGKITRVVLPKTAGANMAFAEAAAEVGLKVHLVGIGSDPAEWSPEQRSKLEGLLAKGASVHDVFSAYEPGAYASSVGSLSAAARRAKATVLLLATPTQLARQEVQYLQGENLWGMVADFLAANGFRENAPAAAPAAEPEIVF